MLSYCLKCRMNTENKNPEASKTSNETKNQDLSKNKRQAGC